MIDVSEKKRKIISFLETNGPSIPVRIAKTIEMDPVFASAILSELLGTKQIKMSHMKVGSSPLYLIPGQEKKLEEHSENLKPIEKETYLKLKEKTIISDEEESPVTRIALRNIKDFATPFKFKEKIMWKYSFAPEEEIQKILLPQEDKISAKTEPEEKESMPEKKEEINDVPKAWEAKKEEIKQIKEEPKKIENIFEEKEKKQKTFLEKIEEFLEKKQTKIISIEEVDKKKVIAKIEAENKRAVLFAFNKKKISEDELKKCYKQAKASNLPYRIIIMGNPTNKMNETIDTYKKLIKIEKLNNT